MMLLPNPGWLAFAILMAAHLLKDLISGTKLLMWSGKRRYFTRTRLWLFFGGWLLNNVTAFSLFVSTIYNQGMFPSFVVWFHSHPISYTILFFALDHKPSLQGMLLSFCVVTFRVTATYSSYLSINASDTELIMNAVVILFLCGEIIDVGRVPLLLPLPF